MTMEQWKKRYCDEMPVMATQAQEEKVVIQLCVSEVDSKQQYSYLQAATLQE